MRAGGGVGHGLARFLVCVVLLHAGAGAAVASVSPSVLAQAEQRLVPRFAEVGLAYPPQAVTLVALKREARLELWADGGRGWTFVRSYLVRASSGGLGPKRRLGDHQVPEGVYGIEALNPDSLYHLSMRIAYPNAFDRARAMDDGRTRLGGDIMIHGSNVSDGCIPVGDEAVEELYALTSRVGTEAVRVIISPLDLRRLDVAAASARATERPSWLPALYTTIAAALADFRVPSSNAPASPPRRLAVGRPRCRAYDETDCVRRCNRGDTASCARAGLMYALGRRATADPAKAWRFLEKACAGGDALGCAELSQLYVTDDGLRRDTAHAAALAEAACNAGDGHGCRYLARLCIERLIYPGSPKQCTADYSRRLYERAVATLQRNCTGWGAFDCYTLATMYADRDATTAWQLAQASCRAGDPGGCEGFVRPH